jgi:molybdopterin converting factor small subunit
MLSRKRKQPEASDDEKDLARLIRAVAADDLKQLAKELMAGTEVWARHGREVLNRARGNTATVMFLRHINAFPCALYAAVMADHVDMVRALVEARADVNQREGPTRCTLLHIDSHSDRMFSLLIELGADVEARSSEGCTPWHFAMLSEENYHHMSRLLDHGANVNSTVDELAALHVAVIQGNARMVRLLLERKACVNANNDKQLTPLHMAVRKNDETIVSILLEAGANPLQEYKTGGNSLDMLLIGTQESAKPTDAKLVSLLLLEQPELIHTVGHSEHNDAFLAKCGFDRSTFEQSRIAWSKQKAEWMDWFRREQGIPEVLTCIMLDYYECPKTRNLFLQLAKGATHPLTSL